MTRRKTTLVAIADVANAAVVWPTANAVDGDVTLELDQRKDGDI